jgi:Carboxypeptidase regulatory-like domain
MAYEQGRPGGIVSGVVRDSAGRPVAGARAFFSAGPVPFPDIAAVTDQTGRFTLSAPAAGTYEVTCSGESGAAAAQAVEVAEGGESPVELRLDG